MVNAVSLARALDLDFRFVWPRSAEWGFSEPGQIFDDDFLKQYEITESDCAGRVALPDPGYLSLADAKQFCLSAQCNSAVYVEEWSRIIKFSDESEERAQTRFRSAFDAIGWSTTAKLLLSQISTNRYAQDYIALHVRAGDIVNGDWKQFVPVEKYIPTPYLEFAIKALHDSHGKPILVLSDNGPYARELKNRFTQVVLSSDFFPGYANLSEIQSAFADSMAISHASCIVGPRASAFSRLGALLAGKPVQSINEFTPLDDAKCMFGDGITQRTTRPKRSKIFSPLVARDICWHHDVFCHDLSISDRIEILQDAVSHEPEFCGALNRLAAALALAGQVPEANKASRQALDIATTVNRHDDPMVESLSVSISVRVLALSLQPRGIHHTVKEFARRHFPGFLESSDAPDRLQVCLAHDFERCQNLGPYQINHDHVLQNLQYQIALASWLTNADHRLRRVFRNSVRNNAETATFQRDWRRSGFEQLTTKTDFAQALRNLELISLHLARAIGNALSTASLRQPSVGVLDGIETCQSGLKWVHGWFRESSEKGSPIAVAYFHNNKIVSGGVRASKRPDVANHLKDPTAENCGFTLPVPIDVKDVGDIKNNIRIL